MSATQDVDVCIIGAGFSGLSMLHKSRIAGFQTVSLERACGIGGTWFSNRYPGARVDIPSALYQFSSKDLWEDFTWSERYASAEELQRYFTHVDQKWQLSKDIQFNKEVKSATFDEEKNKWIIECQDGTRTVARWFVPALGYASKAYTPSMPGLDKFTSNLSKQATHTAHWPVELTDLQHKRVGVIGTGASGVQIIQELAPVVKYLSVFQRTPSQTLPLQQRSLTTAEQDELKLNGTYEHALNVRSQSYGGTNLTFQPIKTFDTTPTQREAYFQKLWDIGGFTFVISGYQDLIFDKAANDAAYAFLARKNRERILDVAKRDVLVPLQASHQFGTKRACLEQNYYEAFNRSNVDVFDISEKGSPILGMNEEGIITKDGVVELDVVIFATGFDSVSGGLTQIDIQGVNCSLAQKWRQGAASHTGIAIHGFPNMFYTYGLHSPGAFANGPSCIEPQTEWITQTLVHCRGSGVIRIEATVEAELDWTKKVNDMWSWTLFPGTKSWYQGDNIPGKKVEPLNYIGGLPTYLAALKESAEQGYQGFTQVHETKHVLSD